MGNMVNTENKSRVKVELDCPIKMPKASGFLWNKKMVVQVNCRGYVNSQYMQPEPRKYSYAPNMEEKTFIQPEHSYFTHHPGRFFYIKDEDLEQCFSVPYEPMRKKLDKFSFVQTASEIYWLIEHLELSIKISISLSKQDIVERWSLSVKNMRASGGQRNISIYPYFTIGYMSWMNQSACFNEQLNAIVASAITPYQKVEQYFKNKDLKEKSFFIADKKPTTWHTNQAAFEGEGGLHAPDALKTLTLSNDEARYETPVAVFQYRESFGENEGIDYQFLFGPAKDELEIATLAKRYFGAEKAKQAQQVYDTYIAKGQGCLAVNTGAAEFDDFVNHWLPRQMYYHGDVNRLSTDPQTRNYIQDNMGMCYINPNIARDAFILALSQQQVSGAMPDGILLHEQAELKYINQIPHADHCVWLPICLAVYLNETGDVSLLSSNISFADSNKTKTFSEHIMLALDWLLAATDHRDLSLIEQGDWCDPMNMVGYRGKGVSSWLSLATAYALNTWCDLCDDYNINIDVKKLMDYRLAATTINKAVNSYLWADNWFARGITDENRVFGTVKDNEGQIYLNPQSWAILSGAASPEQQQRMIKAITKQLMTPYGVMMLAPSYTHMIEDIGRITQKHPGVSENGSVYNHAAIFYAYSLYQINENDLAFDVLKKILPAIDDADQSGQRRFLCLIITAALIINIQIKQVVQVSYLIRVHWLGCIVV
ncbi:NdvB protein [Colwellia sp. MSW7]|uniref:NdvB protein n=1 Tax=Colwellia maritima TaxID=2912588 RepID=A0ABS9WYL6_9GAMM|nr:NdvB protein [Colwellia maritima]MCI2283058.1 NdvB protein [Colwellia maritima]